MAVKLDGLISSPIATRPGVVTTSPPMPRFPPSSALIVFSTERSRSIPSGCGRVVITQRSIAFWTSISTAPTRMRRADERRLVVAVAR